MAYKNSYMGDELDIRHKRDDQYLPTITFQTTAGAAFAASGLSAIQMKIYTGQDRNTTLATITEADGISYNTTTGVMTFTVAWADIGITALGVYYYDIAWTSPSRQTGAYGKFELV